MRNFFILTAILILFFFACGTTEAAQFYLSPSSLEIDGNDRFAVDLVLNTEKERINAIEGKIIFPADVVGLETIESANSFINFWIEEPSLESEGQIIFSGITPGGYIGKQGFVLSLVFQTRRAGQGDIGIQEARVLLNDGEGSEATLTLSQLPFRIPSSTRAVSKPRIIDSTLPETFVPGIARHFSLFGGKWFLVFATQDKGSGIDHYEVLEEKQWVRAKSPYLLLDQSLKSLILVKAVDKAGNYLVDSLELTMEPLKTPAIVEYPQKVSTNEFFLVKGTALPNEAVLVWFQRGKEPPPKRYRAEQCQWNLCREL